MKVEVRQDLEGHKYQDKGKHEDQEGNMDKVYFMFYCENFLKNHYYEQ